MAAKNKKPKRILNCIASKNTEKDWSLQDATAAGMTRAGAIPPKKDLRESWWKIGNQGETGSCVGWASADGVMRWHFTKAERLAKTEQLSVRFIWMAAKETDEFTSRATTFLEPEGTSLKAALDIARKYGNVNNSQLPFASAALATKEEGPFYALASRLKISAYFNLAANPAKKLAAIREWLAKNGPVLTRLDCDKTWDDIKADGKLTTYLPATANGGHAVTFVGYTPDYFIIRNSWGAQWGDKGFAYASNAYVQAAFTEAYGVEL